MTNRQTTLLTILLSLPLSASAHPGGLDKYGGHTDKKTGKYHFHRDAQGRKFAEPVDGVDPDKNGGKTVLNGTPKYEDDAKPAEKTEPKKSNKKSKEDKAVATSEESKTPAAAPEEPRKEKAGKSKKKSKAEKASEKSDAAAASATPEEPKKEKAGKSKKKRKKAAGDKD